MLLGLPLPISPPPARSMTLWGGGNHWLVIPGPKQVWLFSARALSALTPAWWDFLPGDTWAPRGFRQFREAHKTEFFHQTYS